MTMLFGAGGIGLRALATGIPASVLMNPRKAFADPSSCPDPSKAQFVILSTSGGGDPINTNCPGTYSDTGIVHATPGDGSMNATNFTMGGTAVTAAKPWAPTTSGGALAQTTLDRTMFFHMATNTPIHPQEPQVLQLMGASPQHEMLPSLLAKATAPCLGTVQTQPVCIGASTPAEAIQFSGSPLPIIPPAALKDTLTNPTGPLTNLQGLRDQTMNQIYQVYRNAGTPSQQQYIDKLVLSQQQVRNLNIDLLNQLANISTTDSVLAQVQAAVILVQLKVSPVITIHIPFGGDNHSDAGFANETAQTITGVGYIASLMAALNTAGVQDSVTFMTLNVFGRTMAKSNPTNNAGRGHNANHHVAVVIGKQFKAGVVGGVTPVANDYGCTGINASTGGVGSDIAAGDTLASFGKTMLQAVGGDPTQISSGQVVAGALK